MAHQAKPNWGYEVADRDLESVWSQAQAYWDSLIDYERKSALPEDLKLERMRALLANLGNPQDGLRIIHVAGTKGKGSCCAMLESILRKSGWLTGLFVSPHIRDVTERFQINGCPVSKTELGGYILRVQSAVKSALKEPPSFFEVATTAAFLLFRSRQVDWVILETGLGGRLDATNVCKPIITLITGIGLDHTQVLGETLEEIAYEKAGIIKPGIPVVFGVEESGPKQVIRNVARLNGAPQWELGKEIHVWADDRPEPAIVWDRVECHIKTPVCERDSVQVGLSGNHQAKNAALVLGVVDQLKIRGTEIPEAAVYQGLSDVNWPGRIETLCKKPWIVVDAAHNVASIEALVEMLRHWPVSGKKKLLFAVSRDKSVGEMLALLAQYFDEIHLTKYTLGQRAMEPEEVKKHLPLAVGAEGDPHVTIHNSPSDALDRVLPELDKDSGLCVAGSIFLLGEVRDRLITWAEKLD